MWPDATVLVPNLAGSAESILDRHAHPSEISGYRRLSLLNLDQNGGSGISHTATHGAWLLGCSDFDFFSHFEV
jgi:hypothetical protein